MIRLEKYISGEIRKSIGYKYFMPSFINAEWIWTDPKLNKLIENASFELGQLNSFAKLVPNVDLFIHLHITKEAVVSSKIEGTQTHFDEAFLQKEDVTPQRKDDWQEVQNYTEALNTAIEELKTLPISSRLILKTHQTLLQGVRSEKKTPGKFHPQRKHRDSVAYQSCDYSLPVRNYPPFFRWKRKNRKADYSTLFD